jgi:hypothetical protein
MLENSQRSNPFAPRPLRLNCLVPWVKALRWQDHLALFSDVDILNTPRMCAKA